MYQNHKIIATICARGGSKGIKGKNIKKLAGKPLLHYSIDSALNCELIDKLVVSTDNFEIKKIAERKNIEMFFLRPARLADDKSSRVLAVIHAVKKSEKYFKEKYQIVIDLGNVCPFRNSLDITNCIKKLVDTKKTNIVVSVNESHRNPYFNMLEATDNDYIKLVKKLKKEVKNRQSAPQVYDMNDAVFAIWKDKLFKYKSFIIPRRRIYEMPKERSIDIDNSFDWQLAEYIIGKNKV